MGERNNKLTPDIVQKLSALTDVRKISDLEEKKLYDVNSGEINTSNEFIGSYLVTSTFLNDRYYNFRIKLQELTNYIREIGGSEVISFKKAFEYFITQLKENTQNSYVQFTPVYGENAVGDEVFSYTFNYKLSEITTDIIPFDDSEYGTTYIYTDKLTDGLITSDVLEQYMRNTVGRILGVPNTPAAVSEAIDSIIEFVDWFKGFTTGTNFSNIIDPNRNKLVFGKTTYILEANNLGQIGFTKIVDDYNYTNISYTLLAPDNATQNYEINDPAGELTLQAKPTKDCEVTSSSWNNVSVGTRYNKNDTIESTRNQYLSNTTTSFSLKIKDIPTESDISHGYSSGSSATINVKVQFNKFKIFVFETNTNNLETIASLIHTNNNNQPQLGSLHGKYKLYSGEPNESVIGESFTINSADNYICFLLPSDYVHIDSQTHLLSNKGIYWKGTEGLADYPGPTRYKQEISLYNSRKEYTLFVSEGGYPSGTVVNLKYK